MTKILVVEDDHHLRDVLVRGLRAEGFEVVSASDGHSALSYAGTVGAVVLDVGLPDSDGRDVCQALRSRGVQAPILLLTARDRVEDRLSGFAAGADDHIGKPFEFAELVARLNAALRRAAARPVAHDRALVLDPVGHALLFDEMRVLLSPTEFRLLARLLADPDAVVRRGQLRAAGWPAGGLVSDNTLDQYIRRLRRRLADVSAPVEILTVRGLGYRVR